MTPYQFTDWPFREVPSPARCTFLLGRPDLKQKLNGLLSANRPSASSIYMFWAALGSGKSHALYYLINQLSGTQSIGIYTEFPERPVGFVDLYRSLAQRVDWDRMGETSLALLTDPNNVASSGLTTLKQNYPDLFRAYFLLATDDDPQLTKLARRWLRGEELIKSELRQASLARSIETPQDCSSAISVLATITGLRSGDTPSRLVWVIDECQRLGAGSNRLQDEMNAGLQSTFNATPDHLVMMLSFSGEPDGDRPPWLKPELLDRIGTRNLLALPPFDAKAAKAFLAELVAQFRVESGRSLGKYFPFSEQAVDVIMARAARIDGGEGKQAHGIRPRAIMKLCHAVLQEHSDRGLPVPVTDSFVNSVLPK